MPAGETRCNRTLDSSRSTRSHGRLPVLLACSILLVSSLPLWMDREAEALDLQRWALNAGPFLLLWAALALLCARPLFAALLTSGFAALFYLVHSLKSANLGLPLLPADLQMAGQLLTSPELYLRYLHWPALAGTFAALGVLVLMFRLERPQNRNRPTLRLSAAAVLLAFGAALCAPQAQSWSPYAPDRLRATVWHPATAARELGAVALFVKLLPHTRASLPEPDRQRLAEFSAQHAAALAEAAELPLPEPLPDIVVVQSESFFDPRRLRGLESLPALGAFDRLGALGAHGLLRVPTFGGLTTRTEFEFLTGFPLHGLPQLSYPFQGLVHRPVQSLAWSLRGLGYQSIAVHPYEPRFYQRDRVYPLLGFEAFHDESSFPEAHRDGYYVADQDLLDYLRRLLERPGPQFLFAVTMENHGPWDDGRGPAGNAQDLPLPDGLGDVHADPLRRFLHHLENADRSLATFADWVLQREEPTVLLFYGDHLPALDGVFSTLGFADGEPANRQPTAWLLLDNRSRLGERRDLGSHQLAALLLQRAGLHRDAYFSALQTLADAEAGDPATHLALAAEHLTRPIDPLALTAAAEAKLVEVIEWGPQELEAHYAGGDEVPLFWLHASEPIPTGAGLELGGRRLQVVHRTERFLLARPGHHHFGSPGEPLPLRLSSTSGRRAQTLGEVGLRPPTVRVRMADDSLSRLCDVEDWGPQESAVDEPANRQPDGRMGLWVRAACLPPQVQIEFAGQTVETTVQGRLATAAVALDGLRHLPTLPIALVDPLHGHRLAVGELRWIDPP